VRVGTGVAFGLAGVGGSLVGSALNRQLDPNVLLLGFSALVLTAAWRMRVGCPTCSRTGEATEREVAARNTDAPTPARPRLDATRIAWVVVAGSAVGFVTGLFGVGGGFVIVPALALILLLPTPQAIGTSLLVIVINSAVALTTRLATTTVDWTVAGPFAVAATIGALAGSRIADRLEPQRSARWFSVLLIGVGVYTGARAGASLA
jgi:uncharacterized membrane protein YfcA